MPIREYKCNACKRTVERVEFKEELPPVCDCLLSKGFVTSMQRVRFSKPAPAQFRGGGWAAEGYARKRQ